MLLVSQNHEIISKKLSISRASQPRQRHEKHENDVPRFDYDRLSPKTIVQPIAPAVTFSKAVWKVEAKARESHLPRFSEQKRTSF